MHSKASALATTSRAPRIDPLVSRHKMMGPISAAGRISYRLRQVPDRDDACTSKLCTTCQHSQWQQQLEQGSADTCAVRASQQAAREMRLQGTPAHMTAGCTRLQHPTQHSPLVHHTRLAASESAWGVIQPAAALIAQQHALRTADAVQHARGMRTCQCGVGWARVYGLCCTNDG